MMETHVGKACRIIQTYDMSIATRDCKGAQDTTREQKAPHL